MGLEGICQINFVAYSSAVATPLMSVYGARNDVVQVFCVFYYPKDALQESFNLPATIPLQKSAN